MNANVEEDGYSENDSGSEDNDNSSESDEDNDSKGGTQETTKANRKSEELSNVRKRAEKAPGKMAPIRKIQRKRLRRFMPISNSVSWDREVNIRGEENCNKEKEKTITKRRCALIL